ncbi:MAG: TonB-dependent receptor plug domain-containing protein, partial [Gracilimonas sp.]
MYYYLKILPLVLLFNQIHVNLVAQPAGDISGIIMAVNEPVPSASVGIKTINKGSFSDEMGRFHLKNIPPGEYLLKVSAIGFEEIEKKVRIESNKDLFLEINLKVLITELDQVVVTGTLKETVLKDSPVKVNWVSGESLEKSGSDNLMDAIKYINGLYKQVDCAICGTSNIRINGMEGPYTAVLIDGMPIMGALASVYGLNGINPNIIQNLEIIKGPNSTLYGSQAMGGVVNIITKNPKKSPLFSVQASTSSHSEHNLNLSYAPSLGKSDVLFSGTLYKSNAFIDENGDDFSDLTQDTRFTFFNKWNFERQNFKKTS